jgi:hypothetical protein
MKLGSLSPGTGHGGGLIGTTKHSNKSKQKTQKQERDDDWEEQHFGQVSAIKADVYFEDPLYLYLSYGSNSSYAEVSGVPGYTDAIARGHTSAAHAALPTERDA